LDVHTTSRKMMFIQLSHDTRLPLYVSPVFSSTSCTPTQAQTRDQRDSRMRLEARNVRQYGHTAQSPSQPSDAPLAAQSLFGAGIAAAAHQHNGTVVTRGTQQDAAATGSCAGRAQSHHRESKTSANEW
jgi:hypothetical protein